MDQSLHQGVPTGARIEVDPLASFHNLDQQTATGGNCSGPPDLGGVMFAGPVFGGVGTEVPVPEAATDTGPPAFDFGTFLVRRD